MARAGKSVCVLERGCDEWPGGYPNAVKNMHPSSMSLAMPRRKALGMKTLENNWHMSLDEWRRPRRVRSK